MHHLIGFKEFLFVVHYYSNIPWFIQFNSMHKFVNMKDRGQVWLLCIKDVSDSIINNLLCG